MARFCFFTQFLLLSSAALLLASDSSLIKGKLFVSEVGGAPHVRPNSGAFVYFVLLVYSVGVK